MKKTSFCFYVGRKLITEVIAETSEEAWQKANHFYDVLGPACVNKPVGVCVNSDDLHEYFQTLN